FAMAKIGNLNAISDTGIAGEMALAACRSASLNVLINLNFLRDPEYSKKISKEHEEILEMVESLRKELDSLVVGKIKN
ncbi:MAG: cyclodeaminase/cyclohydrolase family protein, partial [candidate division WOR-3 bacterium]